MVEKTGLITSVGGSIPASITFFPVSKSTPVSEVLPTTEKTTRLAWCRTFSIAQSVMRRDVLMSMSFSSATPTGTMSAAWGITSISARRMNRPKTTTNLHPLFEGVKADAGKDGPAVARFEPGDGDEAGIVTSLNGRAIKWHGTQTHAVAVCYRPVAWLRKGRNVLRDIRWCWMLKVLQTVAARALSDTTGPRVLLEQEARGLHRLLDMRVSKR